MSRRVTLTSGLDYNGRRHKKGETLNLPDELAIKLVTYGRARKAAKPAPKKQAATKSESPQAASEGDKKA